MPNSNRWRPFIDDKRICIECKENKLKEDYYHRKDGSVSRTCKICFNKIRRDSYDPSSSRKGKDSRCIKQKECKSCKILKDRNDSNFNRSGRRSLLDPICKDCRQNFTLLNKEIKKVKGPKDDNDLKHCNICKEEKYIKDFSYNKKQNFYSYCCKKCDVERQKKRNDLDPIKYKEQRAKIRRTQLDNNKHKIILKSYTRIDQNKGLKSNLTEKFVYDSLKENCIYCGYKSTGLDRLDNTIGHTNDNCVPCCKDCNVARMNNFTHEEMKVIGQAIKFVKDYRKLLN